MEHQCPDSYDDPAGQGQRHLAERLEIDQPLWPLHQSHNVFAGPSGVQGDWPDEVFFEVIEALDEVVARPRRRRWHSFHDDWDYEDYARPAGQAVYRWRVNELLDRCEVPLRLAESAPDAGLLVHATGDPRDELLEQVLNAPATVDTTEVEHAVQRFRSRTATREDKRSAVLALHRVFERRSPLLKGRLTKDENGRLTKDENDLHNIANNFDLRHAGTKRNRKDLQQGDYDEAFLDWLFWWYLATLELTDRLLARPVRTSDREETAS